MTLKLLQDLDLNFDDDDDDFQLDTAGVVSRCKCWSVDQLMYFLQDVDLDNDFNEEDLLGD